MKRIFKVLLGLCAILLVAACSDDEERSFSIDDVTIDAQIDIEGNIHVRELYTYTFLGAYEGMTREIRSDVQQFKAFLLDVKETDPTIQTDDLKPLNIEKDESTWKIYSDANHETKQVLYSYMINGSITKYKDIADFTYAFFDESNETDLHNVKISIHTPAGIISRDTHHFLRGDETGTLAATDSEVTYTNDMLKAGKSSEIRVIFPAIELSQMGVTKDKLQAEKILTAEYEMLERKGLFKERIATITPMIWGFLLVVILAGLVIFNKHPNRFRRKLTIDELTDQLEKTDPLFVSYLNQDGHLIEKNIISALFSLKQRGIVVLQESPSVRTEGEKTFRFTWKNNLIEVDLADDFLRKWLFTEKDDDGLYFLLESILDDESQKESIREEKAERFRQKYLSWSDLIVDREEYQQLKDPFHIYSRFSAFVTLITLSLFYYMTKIEPITQTEQLVLTILFMIIGIVCLIFSQHKWLLLLYYPSLIFVSLIFFTWNNGTILLMTFYMVSFLTLMIIPSKYWRKDILYMKHVVKQSRQLMKKGEYPVGENYWQLEKRLEYALILNVEKKYVEHFDEGYDFNQLDLPLLGNINLATETFNTGNLVLLPAGMGVNGNFGTAGTSTSSTGGGGAGAF